MNSWNTFIFLINIKEGAIFSGRWLISFARDCIFKIKQKYGINCLAMMRTSKPNGEYHMRKSKF